MNGVLHRIGEAAASLVWLAAMVLVFGPALLIVAGFYSMGERR